MGAYQADGKPFLEEDEERVEEEEVWIEEKEPAVRANVDAKKRN